MSQPVDGALMAAISNLEKQFESLKHAHGRLRWINRLLLLGLLAFLVTFGYLYYSLGKQLAGKAYQDEVQKQVTERLGKRSDLFKREGKVLQDKLQPALAKLVQEQLTADAPKYSKQFEKQRAAIEKKMPKQMEARLHKQFHEVVAGSKQEFTAAFPEYKENSGKIEKLMDSTEAAMDKILQKNLVPTVEAEVTMLFNGIDKFPMADKLGKDDPPYGEQLMGFATELLPLALAESKPVADDSAKPLPRRPAKVDPPTPAKVDAPKAAPAKTDTKTPAKKGA